MAKNVLPLNGRAQELIRSLRPGDPANKIEAVAVHLDRMIRSGLAPHAIRNAMTDDSASLLRMGYDKQLGRITVRPASTEEKVGSVAKSPHVANRDRLADIASSRITPVVGNFPNSAQTKMLRDALKSKRQQDVMGRLSVAVRFDGAVVPVSINSITEWEKFDAEPSRAHVARVRAELQERQFSIVDPRTPSRVDLRRCPDTEGAGLFTVEHYLVAAHRKAPNSEGQTIARDVLVGVVESYTAHLSGIADYVGTGSIESLFGLNGKPTEEALIAAGMAVEERDPTLIVPLSTAVVVQNFARTVDTPSENAA